MNSLTGDCKTEKLKKIKTVCFLPFWHVFLNKLNGLKLKYRTTESHFVKRDLMAFFLHNIMEMSIFVSKSLLQKNYLGAC